MASGGKSASSVIVAVDEGRRVRPATDWAASIASSAMMRYVVHFPPITLTSPCAETSTRCPRES